MTGADPQAGGPSVSSIRVSAGVCVALALALEQLNAKALPVLALYPQMETQGHRLSMLFGAVVFLAVFVRTAFALKWVAAVVGCAIPIALFFGVDYFLTSDWVPRLERKSVEWTLAVLYGLSFGTLGWVLTAGWIVLSRTVPHGGSKSIFVRNDNSPAVVVFVHGLGGDAVSTWGLFPTLIASDPDLRDFDVFLWGYPTKVVGRTPSISEAATQLQTELRHRLGNFQSVVLAGHSLGGLLIRALIVHALEQSRIEDVERVNHILTFATPNDGSELAQIARLFRIGNKQIRDLDLTETTIIKLRNEWIDRVYAPEIRRGEERVKRRISLTAVVGLEDRIVTFDSARAFFRNPPPETVPGDHVTMKLPESSDSICYLVLKRLLQAVQASAVDRSNASELIANPSAVNAGLMTGSAQGAWDSDLKKRLTPQEPGDLSG